MNPRQNGQPTETTSTLEKQRLEEHRQAAESAQLRQKIVEVLNLHRTNPTSDIRNQVETLLTSARALTESESKLPTTYDLETLSWDEIIHLLEAALPRGTNSFPIPQDKRERRNWMIRNWLPVGTIGMLTGTGGAGKSLLALQLAMSLAAGQQDWIGSGGTEECLQLNDAAPFRVVYAPYEDELNIEIADHMDWIDQVAGGGLYAQMKDRLHIEPMDEPIWSPPVGATRWQPAELTETGKQLRALCERHRADLLIVDPVVEATIIDDVDNAAIGDFIRSWRIWARTEPKCAVMLLHHLSKADALKKVNDDDISGYRGGTAWQAGVRWLWMLKADKEQSTQDRTAAQLRPLKSSYAKMPPEVYLYREKTTHWTWQTDANTSNATAQTTTHLMKGNHLDSNV